MDILQGQAQGQEPCPDVDESDGECCGAVRSDPRPADKPGAAGQEEDQQTTADWPGVTANQ